MIQLLKVGHLIPQSTENVESNTPQNPLMSANPKIAFWVMDEVNFTEYIDDVKKQSTDMGFEKVCNNSVSDIYVPTLLYFKKRKKGNEKKFEFCAVPMTNKSFHFS